MAIVFLDHTINGKILNAYNNNVVRFKSDTGNSLNADITVTANSLPYSFQITPNQAGEYYFNFKSIAIALINTSLFADACPYSTVGTLWADPNAYLNISVEYKINITDVSFETASYSYDFIKAVNQITEKALFNNRGLKFPMHQPYFDKYYLTLFKGYPFSIGIFGENATFTLDGVSKPQVNVKQASRFILSKGDSLWPDITKEYHTIVLDGKTIVLNVKDICAGVYLKWHNQYGAWDYWLFDKNIVDDLKSSSIGSLENDFDNLSGTSSPSVSMGKDSNHEIDLIAQVSREESARVRAILDSPKVYFYIGLQDEANSSDNWIEVRVSGKSTALKSSSVRNNIAIKMSYPKPYTLTL